MKILYLNHNVAFSRGTFFRAYHFARHLAKRGHKITLLSIAKRNRFRYSHSHHDGVDLVETPDLCYGKARSGWDFWDLISRIYYLYSRQFDIIHAFDCRPIVIIPALLNRRRSGGRLIIDWADWWGSGGVISERPRRSPERLFGPIEAFFEEHFRSYADATTVISKLLERRAISLRVPGDTILRIPHGSDVEGIVPMPKEKAREMLRLPEHVPIVGYLGALLPADAEFLLEVYHSVKSSRPETILLLIGNQTAEVTKVRTGFDNIMLTGYVRYELLPKYLCSADVLVLPLRDSLANRAKWPSKMNDYLASGRPIVATDVGEITDVFREHKPGLLSLPRVEDFSNNINRLLQDSRLRDELGRNGRRLAETSLSWTFLTQQLEEFYSNVLSRP